MADHPKAVEPKAVDPKDAEIAALKAQLHAAKSTAPQSTKEFLAARAVLAEEHKGTKTYVVGPTKHYRDGRMYQAGELVTVTNERPAKDWVLADLDARAAAKAAAKAVVAPSGRASDKSVG